MISDATSDTAYVSHFFPREFKIWSKSIQAKQGRYALLLKLVTFRSLLRTYEKSTCSKSKNSCGSTNLRKVIIVGCVITRHVTCHLKYTNKTRYSLLIGIILVLPSAGVMEAIRIRLYPHNINSEHQQPVQFSILVSPRIKTTFFCSDTQADIIYWYECVNLDCEKPLFFFRFSKGSARAGERWAAKPRVSRLQSRAWSFACLGRFGRRTKKKERLLVV